MPLPPILSRMAAATEETLQLIYGLLAAPVPPATLPLPTGAATAAKQDLQPVATQFPAALVGGKLSTTDPTALPLPSGAATSAKQDLQPLATQLPAALVGGKLSTTDPTALPLPSGASTSALQTSGAQKTQVTDSSGNAVAVVDGKLRTIANTYGQAIAEGLITGHTKWKVVGFRSAVSTAESHLAIGATGRFPWPAAAQKVYLVSSSVADDGDPPGTGARTVFFCGINSAGAVVSETVTLNGTTVVETVGTYIAPCIFDTYVATYGSGGSNAGTITCGTANPPTATTTWWTMTIGTNQAAGSAFYVPATKTAYLMKVFGGEASSQGTTFRMHFQAPGSPWRRLDVYQVSGSTFVDEYLIPPSYVAGTRLEVTAASSSGTAICSCKFLGWLE